LDGRGLSRKSERIVLVEERQPQKIDLQQRQSADDDGPQTPIFEVTTHGHIC
jgi:hypothetical protein